MPVTHARAASAGSVQHHGAYGGVNLGIAGSIGGGAVSSTWSDGGIGGTGVAYGAITAFGSVWVNGVEYSTSNTTFKTDDNPNGGGSQNDLRIGMVVQVDGSISGATASTISEQRCRQRPIM